MKAKWIVRLGQSLRLLGSVRHGAQVGALAVDDNGEYFQVNGEYVAPLKKRFIAKAVSAAQNRMPPRHQAPGQRTTVPPVVTARIAKSMSTSRSSVSGLTSSA